MNLPDFIEVTNRHGRYCVPAGLNHRPGVRVMYSGEIYEPYTIDFICRNAGDGDVVHAGAFCGDFLPALSKATTGTVWAFEPVPEYFACAERTVAINGLKNVRLTNAGLSDTKGQAQMKRVDDQGRDLGGGSQISADGDITAEVIRLDDAVPTGRKVSVLHLDLEGHERIALRGAMGLIARCRPIVVLEADVGSDLAHLGYKFRYLVEHNVIYSANKPQHVPLRLQVREAKRRLKWIGKRLVGGWRH